MEQVGVFTLIPEDEPGERDWHRRCWWCGLGQVSRTQEFLMRRARIASNQPDPLAFRADAFKHPGRLAACPRHFADLIIRRNLELLSVSATLGTMEVA